MLKIKSAYLACVLMVFLTYCNGYDRENFDNSLDEFTPVSQNSTSSASHVSFFIENSGGMFGYVSQGSEFVKAISELAQKPAFISDNVSKEFNFINGFGKLAVTPLGNNPNTFNSKLNPQDFNVGLIQGNDLNAMFQLVLGKASGDSISIFVSDSIYDIQQKDGNPLAQLIIDSRETRRTFLEKLTKENIQTLVIRMESLFDGVYYYGVQNGRVNLNTQRPYFIYIFGENNLLNHYFTDDYLQRLSGYISHFRFFVPDENQVKAQIIPYNMIGSFRPDRNNPIAMNRARPFNNQFQFSIAADFGSLSLTNDYLTDKTNYQITGKYTLTEIKKYSLGMVTNFNPTHLISLKTDNFLPGRVQLKLLNNTPSWFEEYSTDNDSDIQATINKTFGFSHLIDGIRGAYEHKVGQEYLLGIDINIR